MYLIPSPVPHVLHHVRHGVPRGHREQAWAPNFDLVS